MFVKVTDGSLKESNLFYNLSGVIFQISNGNYNSSVSDIFQERFCDYRLLPCLEDQPYQQFLWYHKFNDRTELYHSFRLYLKEAIY